MKPYAYTAKGKPISKAKALEIVRRRSAEMDAGKFLSHEEVKKKFTKRTRLRDNEESG